MIIERKLRRLEGSKKKELTSGCVVDDLSEARENQMRQLIGETEGTGVSRCPQDPLESTSTRMPQQLTEEGISNGREESLPCHCIWLCSVCHAIQRMTCRGASVEITNTKHREESAFLLDCDELGQTWEEQDA